MPPPPAPGFPVARGADPRRSMAPAAPRADHGPQGVYLGKQRAWIEFRGLSALQMILTNQPASYGPCSYMLHKSAA